MHQIGFVNILDKHLSRASGSFAPRPSSGLCPWSLDPAGGIGDDLVGPEEQYLPSIASCYREKTTK